jgi:arsenate reductase-like glutaredoxin family protein
MATETEGERALADLEAGKFSFEMVDAIKDHVSKLETELLRVSALHESAVNELRQQEYTISRLEAELRKLNARLYTLLKANVLTEIALREGKRGAVKFVEYLPVAQKHAEESSKKALAYLSTVDLKSEFEKLKAHPMTETALRVIERLAMKFVEFLPVARKHAEEGLKKALAHLSTVDLKAEFEKLKAHPLTDKTLRESERLLLKARENLPVARKQVAAAAGKATAYIADLHKKIA